MAESDERRRRVGQLLIGRLKDHGAANYQFRRNEDPSYYVRILTARGERILWGKDLERALIHGQTHPNPGDLVGARRVSREAVTITTRQRDSQGRVTTQEEHHAHRTRWEIERVAHFARLARLARQLRDEQIDLRETLRKRPELRAAEDFAVRRIKHPLDRERFLELLERKVASRIQRSEAGGAKKPDPEREDPTR